MSSEGQTKTLEAALLERAQRLADEAVALGRQNYDRILGEENERLRLREEREVLIAKSMAEHDFRRRVQASELQVEAQLDRVRWSLVQEALVRVREALARLTEDEGAYAPVLKSLLREAVLALEQPEVVAQLNAVDRSRFEPQWERLCQEAVPGKRVLLDPDCGKFMGGVRVRSMDDSVRVDNTFEGRIDRYERRLHEIVIERLFGKAMEMEDLVHG